MDENRPVIEEIAKRMCIKLHGNLDKEKEILEWLYVNYFGSQTLSDLAAQWQVDEEEAN